MVVTKKKGLKGKHLHNINVNIKLSNDTLIVKVNRKLFLRTEVFCGHPVFYLVLLSQFQNLHHNSFFVVDQAKWENIN